FAVVLTLTKSASTRRMVGGMGRWGVDKYVIRKFAEKDLTEEEFIAETDKSSGVLLASGYIAGGALAGILVALSAVYFTDLMNRFNEMAASGNPFYEGAYADILGLVPFIILAVFLYLTGRDLVFSRKNGKASTDPME